MYKPTANQSLSDYLSSSSLQLNPTNLTNQIESPQETLRKGKDTLPPYLISKLESNIAHEKDPRGAAVRGWSGRSPQKGAERTELLNRCGSNAFLLPEEKKFPIMQACRQGENNKCTCAIDCGGVQAAKMRARQWGYNDVVARSDAILNTSCKNN